MIESSITKKGQTTLPKPVREVLGLRAGDRVRYVISEGNVRILPVRPIGRLYGVLRHEGPAVTVEQMEQAVADGAIVE
ncbi:MAG: type II toxin-antitoxin system PrlF family antitoxin [Acidobacteriota bacterium]|nr:type II toxin-antitoxin system PrlF family antitoxin [Acidobacteriota bacterium]